MLTKTVLINMALISSVMASPNSVTMTASGPAIEHSEKKPGEIRLEQVTVTATRNPFTRFASTSYASSSVSVDDMTAWPASLTEMISMQPGVAENGQPGLFQVSSIRGVSRQRILTLFNGVRLTSERRAGVAASFIDPLLLQRADVLRGPSSSLYGSGALGGVLQLVPAEFEGVQGHAGYQSEGHERVVQLGWSDSQWTFSGAKRKSVNSEDENGKTLNTGFSQWSALLKWDGYWNDKQISVLWLPSRGQDIGRSNALYPERVIDVPKENHDIVSFSVQDDNGWLASLYMHEQKTVTRTLRPSSRVNDVTNEARDFGGSLEKSLSFDYSEIFLGIEYFGRRDVDALEQELRFDSELTSRASSLDSAQKDEWAVFGTWRAQWDKSRLQFGLRHTYQKDKNKGFSSSSDDHVTGFLGWNAAFLPDWEYSLNIGTGFRFASLTEKYYTGTTGRGYVTGNSELDPEQAINIDAGLHWHTGNSSLQIIAFKNEIKDYIERVTVAPETLTYLNLTKGSIEGVELEAHYQWSSVWSTNFSITAINGEDDKGNYLSDIPAGRVLVQADYETDFVGLSLQWQYRRMKDNIGGGEMEIPSVHLLSASWYYMLTDYLNVNLSLQNLLDEEYFNSADDLSTVAYGRYFEVGLSWRN